MDDQLHIFSRNLQHYMNIAQKHQGDIAKDLGVNKSNVSLWYNGQRYPRPGTLLKLANYLHCSVADLTEDRSADRNNGGKIVKAIRIKVYGKVRAGFPAFAEEDIIDEEEITEAFAQTGEYFALRIDGNSMEPRIRNRDTVIVRKQDTAEDGDIVIALINGYDGVCKKFKRFKDGVMLVSLNPAYEPITFSHAEIDVTPLVILGVVKEVRSRL